MKVTLKLIKTFRKDRGKIAVGTEIEDVIHQEIAMVLWEDDWVKLIPLDSKIQQISYRKDLVFAVIEEKEKK